MSLRAYLAETVGLASAIVRHVADGLTLVAEAINPPWSVHITTGTVRTVWCEDCHANHHATTVYAHGTDPTAAHPVGEWIDCDQEDDE